MDPMKAYSESARPNAAQRLLEVYRIAIEANVREDKETVRHSIALLRSSLRPDVNPALASNLAAIYEQIEAAIETDQFHAAAEILETVHGLWKARIRCDQIQE